MKKDKFVSYWLQFVIITGILIFILFLSFVLNWGIDNIGGIEEGIIVFLISGIGDLIYLRIHKNLQKNSDFKVEVRKN